MFIVSNHPNWAPGDLFAETFQTLEKAERWVNQELSDRASDGVSGSYYVRQVELGDQLRFSSEIVTNISVTAFPEED